MATPANSLSDVEQKLIQVEALIENAQTTVDSAITELNLLIYGTALRPRTITVTVVPRH